MPSKVKLDLDADVREAMLVKLKESGLDAADARKLSFKPCVNGTAAELGMKFPGFQIPYFDFKGRPIEFFRYRFLVSTKAGLNALTDKKDQKYSQPPASPVEAYFPPFMNWERMRGDAKIPLLFTEGELKAACATKMGFPTIGLGGVWNFKSGTQGVEFLASLLEFNWEGRHVYIVYDSDASTNQNVMLAQNALAKRLCALKAHPHIVRLPPGDDAKKVGLDDFLVAHGPDALKDLLSMTEEWAHSKEMHQLNEEVIYVKDPGLIYRFDNGQRLSPQAFLQHAYANRTMSQEIKIVDKKGKEKTSTKLIPLAPEWLKWDARAEVERISYAPGKERIIVVPGTTFKELNTWPGWGCQPQPGSVAPWHKLLKFAFKDAGPSALHWFEQWCAYPLMHPGTKMFTACVFYSRVHGVGKSLIGLTLGRIYGKNFSEIDNEILASSYNDYVENKQFVLGEEITGGDKRGVADRLKGMLTREKVRINVKYIPRYELPDCVNYMFNSNHPDSFFLEDTDRRFFITEIKGGSMDPAWYRESYDPWMRGDGPSSLFYYLTHGVDMTGFDPRMPAPMTVAKAEMIADGRSDLGMWVATFIAEKGHTRTLWTAEELLLAYDPMGRTQVTVNGMSRELKRAGAHRPLGTAQIEDGTGKNIRPWILSDSVPVPSGRHQREKLQRIWEAEHKLSEIKAKKFVAN